MGVMEEDQSEFLASTGSIWFGVMDKRKERPNSLSARVANGCNDPIPEDIPGIHLLNVMGISSDSMEHRPRYRARKWPDPIMKAEVGRNAEENRGWREHIHLGRAPAWECRSRIPGRHEPCLDRCIGFLQISALRETRGGDHQTPSGWMMPRRKIQ